MPLATMGSAVRTRLSTSFMKSKLRSQVVPCRCISFAWSSRAVSRWVVSVTPETERVRIWRSASGPTARRMASMQAKGSSPA